MIISLDEYRSRKTQRAPVADEQQELMCVNGAPSRIIPVERLVPAPLLASPALPDDGKDEDLEAFRSLAYALATQI